MHILLYMPLLILCSFVSGTNGGVSVAGTLSSALGGTVVGLAYFVVVLLCGSESAIGVSSPPQWPLLIVTTLSGLLGSLIDSIIGATLQYSGEYRLLNILFLDAVYKFSYLLTTA